MKMTLAALALILGSSTVLATDVKFVNADGSDLSGLCIAAAQSDKPVGALATELKVGAPAGEVLCNGTPIRAFVSQFRTDTSAATLYVVSSANETPETQLCLAALNMKTRRPLTR